MRLSDVVGVEKTSTLGIVPNALTFIKRCVGHLSTSSLRAEAETVKLATRGVNGTQFSCAKNTYLATDPQECG